MKNREFVKFIRDRAKARYVKDSECYLCGTNESLELHHIYSISRLFRKWLTDNNITVNTVDDILDVRDAFIEQHEKELYKDVLTLCKKHHKQLHDLYTQDPPLTTAEKQLRWANRVRDRLRTSS